MVKQIPTNDFVNGVIQRGDDYFTWLKKQTGIKDDDISANEYDALARHLASVEFISVDGIDDRIMKAAKEDLRQQYAAENSETLDEEELLRKSVRGQCCLFEIILHLVRKIIEMTSTSASQDTPMIFKTLIRDAKYLAYEDEIRPDKWMAGCTSHILYRQYENGKYGLFGTSSEDKSLWQQMNDFVDLHTDEDGEWVD